MDWFSTIIGATIGFIASIGTTIVERLIDRAGKLRIYYALVSGSNGTNRAGFFNGSMGGKLFVVPINLEIQNTSNTTRVIRDVSMLIYNNENYICDMIQINSTKDSKTTNGVVVDKTVHEYGGEKNSYSFVIPPRSIQRQRCSFMLSDTDCKNKSVDFDEIRLRYYDERDKTHISHVRKIEDCWKIACIPGDDDWILLK